MNDDLEVVIKTLESTLQHTTTDQYRKQKQALLQKSTHKTEITHGTPHALKLDQWGERMGTELFMAHPRLQNLFKTQIHILRTEDPKALIADFFGAAFEPDPELNQHCTDLEALAFLETTLKSGDFLQTRLLTTLNYTYAEIAAISLAKTFLTSRDRKPREDLNGWESAEGVRQTGRNEDFKFKGAQAAKKALEEVCDFQTISSALGMDQGSSTTTTKGLLQSFRRIQQSDILRAICELAGKYRTCAQTAQSAKTTHSTSSLVGITLDGDPGKILPQELALLDDSLLGWDAMRRLMERQMLSRDLREKVRQERGAIVVVVDESGSMSDEKLNTAKAIALTMLWIAQKQKRWVLLVGFSDARECNPLVIPLGGTDPRRLTKWLAHTYGHGTSPYVPFEALPQRWRDFGCPRGKTDMILLSDGLFDIPPTIAKLFCDWKKKEQVALTTILIEAGNQTANIQAVSDHFFRSTLDLTEDSIQHIFSV